MIVRIGLRATLATFRVTICGVSHSLPARRHYSSQTKCVYLRDSTSEWIQTRNLNSQLLDALEIDPTRDFVHYPNFFSASEQRILLTTCLAYLDRVLNSREARKVKREYLATVGSSSARSLANGFLPTVAYAFEKSHFDGVIDGYREATLTSWPDGMDDTLPTLLRRLYDLVWHKSDGSSANTPSDSSVPNNLLAHILHLSPSGCIDPHIDNIEASAATILGASFGSERVMYLRLSAKALQRMSLPSSSPVPEFAVLLPPGSVYVQRHVPVTSIWWMQI